MPYRKTYRRKRRSRKPWYEKKYSTMQLAHKAYSGMKYLKSVINVEKKVHDTVISGTFITDAGVVLPLSQIPQGDGIANRDGNSVKATYLGLRLNLVQHDSATSTLTRVIVVMDNQQIADSTPVITDLLALATVTSFLAAPSLGRFTVLYDKVQNFMDVSVIQKYLEINIPLQQHIRFNGPAGTDVQKNNFYLMLVGDEATNDPSFLGTTRLRFVDN